MSVSNPIVLGEEESKVEPDENFNLLTLVQPENENWVKCGYLWLRMKLPNGRYAWTHIVSQREGRGGEGGRGLGREEGEREGVLLGFLYAQSKSRSLPVYGEAATLRGRELGLHIELGLGP